MFYYTKDDKQICVYDEGQKLHEFKIINGTTCAWRKKEHQGLTLNRLTINCSGLSQYVVEFGDNIYRMYSYALGQLHGYKTDIDKQARRFLEKIYHNGPKYQVCRQSETFLKKNIQYDADT
ncbi:MAG: hypothetical protein ACI4QM_04800 [Alphaproteobacteria bacterium]